MIFDHNHPAYRAKWASRPNGKWNGAFYYAKEIYKYIIPSVNTDRNWVLLNVEGFCWDHSIVFIHNNKFPNLYDWLKDYNDLILVCGVPETCEKVAHLGTPIYLPLSVDVEYVKTFITEKTRGTAFVGRRSKRANIEFPVGTEYIENMMRTELLRRMATYKQVYAVGRTAIEAKILGCEVLPYDPRFPDPERWKIVDVHDASKILQKQLDAIDGKE